MSLRLLLVAVLLAGCGPTSDAPAGAPPNFAASGSADSVAAEPDASQTAALAIDGEGLRVVEASGSTTPLAFGLPADRAVSAVTTLRGAPADQGTETECGAGPLDYAEWPDGLRLYLQEGQFAGWALGSDADPTITTITGLGIGTSRAEMEQTYAVTVQQTTLGTEFEAGGLSGLLSSPAADATVDALWAGVSCPFR